MSRLLLVCLTVVATLAVAAAVVLGPPLLGLVDVSATRERPAMVERFLEASRRAAIARSADGVEVPPLDDPELARTGVVHYDATCVTCHGAPGVAPAGFASGLDPEPPPLHERALAPARVFRVVKHGIWLTGMPAFGPDHSDEDVWSVTAFVQQLPQMTEADYARAVEAAGLDLREPRGHHHGGDDDGPHHER